MDNRYKEFHGKVKSMKLYSSSLGGFGLKPEADSEVDQELQVNADGRVLLKAFNYGENGDCRALRYEEEKNIPPLMANFLLSALGLCFTEKRPEDNALDCGSWELELTNEEDEKFEYHGCLVEAVSFEKVDLSKASRKHLNMPQLFMFDGDSRYPIKTAEDELIFVSVSFEESENEYYYICNDPLVQAGDDVIVPAGRLDDATPASVVRVEVLKKENAPYPIAKCKRVITRVE